MGEMRRLNDSIEDEEISAQIDHLEEVTRKIIDLVVKQPKKAAPDPPVSGLLSAHHPEDPECL